jgi:hypothetical protein
MSFEGFFSRDEMLQLKPTCRECGGRLDPLRECWMMGGEWFCKQHALERFNGLIDAAKKATPEMLDVLACLMRVLSR